MSGSELTATAPAPASTTAPATVAKIPMSRMSVSLGEQYSDLLEASTNPGQRVTDQLVNDPGATEGCFQQHQTGRLGNDTADQRGIVSQRMRPQCGERSCSVSFGNDRHQASLA